ncbi:SURF1 family protein [Sphingomonas baiyangensis]|uniref:SURF1-like protein n=1 Tax=Sphingomonas baiyangensis TaxID=2572576 RepID=A0A4U1L0V2_9SPHN|nr:SURF1 family protein [Sphingomonas baiyangensis]TKD50389.1 SURF1 family protein [Sphingomonas baiyangensis]
MKLPFVPTLIVGLAVAAMIGLGFWQLDRRGQKAALLASFARNATLPAIPLPDTVEERDLFRRVTATCTTPQPPTRSAGRSAEGTSGYRFLARCTNAANGAAFVAELGVAIDPRLTPQWEGGRIDGLLTLAPSSTSFIGRLLGGAEPQLPMIVPARPLAPALSASRAPDPANVPDNHLAYAVQWFAFAAIAVAVYLLALRRRRSSGTNLVAPNQR